MSHITRIYGSQQDADAAVAELRAYRYHPDVIHVVHPPATTESTTAEHDHVAQIEHDLRRRGISHAEAALYAPRIHSGGTLVTVNAAYGEGSQAEYIMDGFNPIDSGVSHPGHHAHQLHDPAPLSNALGLKLLINNPAPLSSALGFSALAKKQNSTTKLLSDPAPLSSATKLPPLAGHAAPFSNALKMPTLSKNPAPFSRAIGAPTLSQQPAPFSNKIGWSTLASEPAPLSKLFGLPVLLHKG